MDRVFLDTNGPCLLAFTMGNRSRFMQAAVRAAAARTAEAAAVAAAEAALAAVAAAAAVAETALFRAEYARIAAVEAAAAAAAADDTPEDCILLAAVLGQPGEAVLFNLGSSRSSRARRRSRSRQQ